MSCHKVRHTEVDWALSREYTAAVPRVHQLLTNIEPEHVKMRFSMFSGIWFLSLDCQLLS